MKRKLLVIGSVIIAGLTITVGCKKDDVQESGTTPSANSQTKTAIKENYADIVYANYQDSYDKAVLLKSALTSFTNAPSALTLETARQAWLDAREPYGQTEAFRFSNGNNSTL